MEIILWKTICFFLSHGSITAIDPPGMLSIWMACEARRSKTTHGDGGVVIAKAPRREELEERWALYYVITLCDGVILWITVYKIHFLSIGEQKRSFCEAVN